MSNIESSYRANPLLKREGISIEFTQDQVEEYIKCASDPIYFIQNYVKVVHVDKGVIPFAMWDFQKDMIRTFHDNRFSIVKCPRQVGKCLGINTPIRLRNKSTGEIIEMTMGEFYEQQRAKLVRKEQRENSETPTGTTQKEI